MIDYQIQGPHTKIETTFSSDSERLTAIRSLIEVCGNQYGYAEEITDDLILALDEAISNVIKHAYGDNPNYLIILKSIFEPKKVQFLLYDRGKSFDPQIVEKPNAERYVKEERKGGWGKFLIERVMDQIHYSPSDKGNLLHCIKQIEPEKKRKVDTDLWKQKALNIEDINSLEELHEQIVSVVDALNNENYREMAVNIIVKILMNNLDLPVLLQSFLTNILTKTRAKHGLIYLRDLRNPKKFTLSEHRGVTTSPHFQSFDEKEDWIELISEIKLPIRNQKKTDLGFEWDTLFPLIVGSKMEGLFFLGQKMSGEIYSQEEEKLISDLISLAGIGYRNAKLFTQVWESKKFLESVIDQFTHDLTVIDTDYYLVRLNKPILKKFKLKRFSQAIGKRCYEVFYKKEKPCKSCPVQEVIANKKQIKMERTCPTTEAQYKFHYIPRFNIKRNVEHITILWEHLPPSQKETPKE